MAIVHDHDSVVRAVTHSCLPCRRVGMHRAARAVREGAPVCLMHSMSFDHYVWLIFGG